MPAITTALVGPNALLREGLARILTSAGFRVFASTCSADDLVLAAGAKRRAALLIIEAAEEFQAAVRQIELLKKWAPDARVAVLGDHNYPGDILSIFRAGANAYFTKEAPCDALIKYLELVMLGETILPAAMLSMVIDQAGNTDDEDELGAVPRAGESAVDDATESRVMPQLPDRENEPPQLSDREKCILSYLIAGEPNKSIARKIDIAEATVKVHVKAILRKIRVQNRTQAAIWAMSNGTAISNGSPMNAIGKVSTFTAQPAIAAQPALPPPMVTDPAALSSRSQNGS